MRIAVNLLVCLIAFAYLFFPSMRTGRSLGMRLQHLKMFQDDGTELRTSTAAKRWGILVGVGFAVLMTPPQLSVFVFAAALFLVMRWTRNPNQQGFHDRIAHTIVVAENRA